MLQKGIKKIRNLNFSKREEITKEERIKNKIMYLEDV